MFSLLLELDDRADLLLHGNQRLPQDRENVGLFGREYLRGLARAVVEPVACDSRKLGEAVDSRNEERDAGVYRDGATEPEELERQAKAHIQQAGIHREVHPDHERRPPASHADVLAQRSASGQELATRDAVAGAGSIDDVGRPEEPARGWLVRTQVHSDSPSLVKVQSRNARVDSSEQLLLYTQNWYKSSSLYLELFWLTRREFVPI